MRCSTDHHLKSCYIQKHAAKFSACRGALCKNTTVELKKVYLLQQNLLKNAKTQMDSVNYEVENLHTRRSKPFTEFTKFCMENMADTMCPDKKKWNFIKSVCLSRL